MSPVATPGFRNMTNATSGKEMGAFFVCPTPLFPCLPPFLTIGHLDQRDEGPEEDSLHLKAGRSPFGGSSIAERTTEFQLQRPSWNGVGEMELVGSSLPMLRPF